jgi:hypothetical protein
MITYQLGSGGTAIFSCRSRPSLIQEKPVPIAVPAKYSLGILVPLPPSTNKTHTDLDPSETFHRDYVVPIPYRRGSGRDFDPDLTWIGFGAVPPDPIISAVSGE